MGSASRNVHRQFALAPYTAWHHRHGGSTPRHLFHPDPVSTFSLQYIVHHNQVFTGYFPLLAGKVDHSKEPSVLPRCDHLVHLLYHFCWQRAGKGSVQKTQQGGKSCSRVIQPRRSPTKTLTFWESLSKDQQQCCFLQHVSLPFVSLMTCLYFSCWQTHA